MGGRGGWVPNAPLPCEIQREQDYSRKTMEPDRGRERREGETAGCVGGALGVLGSKG